MLYKPCFDPSCVAPLGVSARLMTLLPTEGRAVAPPANIALHRSPSICVKTVKTL